MKKRIGLFALVLGMGLTGCEKPTPDNNSLSSTNRDFISANYVPYVVSVTTNSDLFERYSIEPSEIDPCEHDLRGIYYRASQPTRFERFVPKGVGGHIVVHNVPAKSRAFLEQEKRYGEIEYYQMSNATNTYYLPNVLRTNGLFTFTLFDRNSNCLLSVTHGVTNENTLQAQ